MGTDPAIAQKSMMRRARTPEGGDEMYTSCACLSCTYFIESARPASETL
jgi:hypothetical protein